MCTPCSCCSLHCHILQPVKFKLSLIVKLQLSELNPSPLPCGLSLRSRCLTLAACADRCCCSPSPPTHLLPHLPSSHPPCRPPQRVHRREMSVPLPPDARNSRVPGLRAELLRIHSRVSGCGSSDVDLPRAAQAMKCTCDAMSSTGGTASGCWGCFFVGAWSQS